VFADFVDRPLLSVFFLNGGFIMKRSELKKQAKAALKDHWGVAILVGLAMVGINWLIGMIPVIGWVVSLAAVVFEFGVAAFYLSVVRAGDIQFTTLFSASFEGFAKKLGTMWLQILYIFLWSLLFWIPGIVKSYSYAMTEYILLDNPELIANEAITKSREMMNGYKWKLFVLELSFIGWRILCMIPLLGTVLSLLYVNPYVTATRAQFYEELKAIKG
jgi:uncharacterized membrane protein